ncbi:3-hydroxyacyl-CoA dehydrogenase NAD-binding domain-containing protein [Methylibium rhizosphaerae]|uniref:3-hydroxyacyl-CoA dehydrogenase NAD-binding domain-containing protein n=1 Tax=Methylibium rhizosphaerae TaxID=2570323 RepID=UPI0011280D04|nr:3-hydroxyacyl-CoA dehydrogenase NAD-binding domain-containing protein [Methylibium rhizosphaerae]
MNARVRLERDGDIAVVVIDNPPVNAGSAAVRGGLLDAMETLRRDHTLRGAVLIGAGPGFIAGADLREFDTPLQEPQLPAVIAAVEGCGKPVVAALHGAALGGGFELALACDARMAAPGTVVGLPEVSLGVIPGAGGTQRLPRIVGIPRAIGMICGAQRMPAAAALDAGLVDAIEPGDLRTAAVAHARAMALAGDRPRLRDRPVPQVETAAVAHAAEAALKAGRGRPAVQAAIDAISAAAHLPIDEGLAAERTLFERLRVSREAAALRHLFFAERDSARHPSLDGTSARAPQRVAVVGAGTMGCGIAITALDAGCDVLLLEQDGAALDRGASRIREHHASRVRSGRLSAADAAGRDARLHASLDWAALGEADVVIEAVFEELAVKQQVFRRVETQARPGAVLASNTSYLDLDAIASATRRPQDVIGLHFFSPAQVMRLVEVVRGRASSPGALATGVALARRMNKLPVVTGNAFGFIGNRVFSAYRRQCEFMLEEGASPLQVDTALQDFGFAMGPFAVADLSGLDIAWRMRQAQAATRDPAARYVHIADRLCEAGRLGCKAGAGYYRYAEGTHTPQADPDVQALIAQCRADKGLAPRSFTNDEIVRRAMLAMMNETALLLADGVARRPADIDVVLANGYGFPRWEGGPVFLARQRVAAALRDDLDWLARCSGPGFVLGDVGRLLAEN